MMAVYGVDTLDPAVSLRRIHVLTRRLPAGALPRVEEGSWSVEAHLLARVSDSLDLLTWVVARIAGSKAQRPEPLPRPGQSKGSDRSKASGHHMKWGDLGSFLKGEGVTTNGR